MSEFGHVEDYLRNVADRMEPHDVEESIRVYLAECKQDAVAHKQQDAAKRIWCYETILEIQSRYRAAYRSMKSASYYEAWCLLERVENQIIFLERHYDIYCDEFKIAFIEKHMRQFQSLFPYKVFLSPGMLVLDKSCSVCGRSISIRNPCEHRIGEIYDGEMCCYVVNDIVPLEISLVEHPVQKYSVPFLKDPETGETVDHYDYSVVKYVIKGLRAPFDPWDIEWTRIRHPHSYFEDVNIDDECPCESGKQYKDCCLTESGVLRPHLNVFFSVPPPEDLRTIQFHY